MPRLTLRPLLSAIRPTALTSTVRAAPTLLARAPTPTTLLTSSLLSLRSSLIAPTTPSSLSALIPTSIANQVRWKAYGAEYQPSQRKRKRKHGFLARKRGGKDAAGMLRRRRDKGRRFLSH